MGSHPGDGEQRQRARRYTWVLLNTVEERKEQGTGKRSNGAGSGRPRTSYTEDGKGLPEKVMCVPNPEDQ